MSLHGLRPKPCPPPVDIGEEIEHESWFSEFLGEGPSDHFMGVAARRPRS
jgi:hypothetical protein